MIFGGVKKDRIYGPGTIDIKGGTIIIYMMLEALSRFAPEVYDAVTWVVLLDASEETEGEHFGRICNERLDGAQACLVFEAGYVNGNDEFKLVTQRKGMMTYRVAVEGKASHAGSDHAAGANAIVQMAEVIKRIAGFTDYERDLTFNVGTVSGGTVTNRVPHHATAWVEMRAFDMDAYHHGVRQMLALQEMETLSSNDGYQCMVLVDIHRKTKPWPKNAGTEQLYAVWRDSAESLGYQVTWQARGGLSDGNFTWENVPTIDALVPTAPMCIAQNVRPMAAKIRNMRFAAPSCPKHCSIRLPCSTWLTVISLKLTCASNKTTWG